MKVQTTNLMSKKLEIHEVTPIMGDATPLLSALAKGTGLYLPYRSSFLRSEELYKRFLTGVPGLGKFPVDPATTLQRGAGPFTVPAPLPQNIPPVAPVTPPTTASSQTAQPVPVATFAKRAWLVEEAWEASKAGRSIALKSGGLLLLTQNTTHAQVLNPLVIAGIPADTANVMADNALNFIHSHGCTSAVIGFTVGGAVAAVTGLIRPGMEKKRRYQLGAAAGVIATILFYFLVPAPNPFVGTWILDATQSRYESGDPPREATYKIDQKGNGLAVSEDYVYDKAAHVSYQLELDGKEHPAPDMTAADTIATTLTKNTLETISKKDGQVVLRETRVLSADQKRMTITLAGFKRSGQEFTNVSAYDLLDHRRKHP